MHHAHIAQRAFDTPLMIAPAKAQAFLSGLVPRITGQEIRFEGVGIAEPDLSAAHHAARASPLPANPPTAPNADRLTPSGDQDARPDPAAQHGRCAQI
ncbi:MAG: hypothetical protein ACU0DE_07925 [Paracoccus sp. (in: a-proteobacteria)]|uniref:hypothetical protein n=1 Tax=Paracoccus sp. TaxID=267 RepID=UPI004058A70D